MLIRTLSLLALVACPSPSTMNPNGSGDGGLASAASVCGDSIVEGDEECDDGNSTDDDGCRNACRNAFCGDGILRTDTEPGAEGHEECEDNNTTDEDGLQTRAKVPVR